MNTYFLVIAEVRGCTFTYGPYFSFEDATRILVDCLEDFLYIDYPEPDQLQYDARIDEVCIIPQKWQVLDTKLSVKYGRD